MHRVWFAHALALLGFAWSPALPMSLGRRIAYTAKALARIALRPLWIALEVIDAVCFPGWRAVAVERPVFVIAGPRTGSTKLHRILSEDDRFLSLRLADILVPFVCAQRAIGAVMALDRLLLGGAGTEWVEATVRGVVPEHIQARHTTDLRAAEEDDLWLQLWAQTGSFSGFLPLPHPSAARRFRYADLSPVRQRAIEQAFRRTVQKALYLRGRSADGATRTFLSKSHGAFRVERLREVFPDAQFVVISRDPRGSIPSIATVNRDVIAWQTGVDWAGDPALWRPYLFGYLADYYDREIALVAGPGPVAALTFQGFCGDLEGAIRGLYEACGWPISPAYAGSLATQGAAQRGFAPKPRVEAFSQAFRCGPEAIDQTFARYRAHLEEGGADQPAG